MQFVSQALPLAALGLNFPATHDCMLEQLKKLDRVESLFLVSKLNLLTSDISVFPENHLKRQRDVYALLKSSKFIDAESARCIDSFVEVQRTSYSYFYRPQLLELIPWLAVWAQHKPDGKKHAITRESGEAFIAALLISQAFVDSRIAPRVIRAAEQSPEDFFKEALPYIRQMCLTSPTVTNYFSLFGSVRPVLSC